MQRCRSEQQSSIRAQLEAMLEGSGEIWDGSLGNLLALGSDFRHFALLFFQPLSPNFVKVKRFLIAVTVRKTRGPWRALRRGPLGSSGTNPPANKFPQPLCSALETVHAAAALWLPPAAGQFQRSTALRDGRQVRWPGDWLLSTTAFVPQQCFNSKCYGLPCPALRCNADVCVF